MFHKDLQGQDLHFARTMTGVGSPVGVVTPNVVGLFYADTAAQALWVSTGFTSADWQLYSSAASDVVSGVAYFTYTTSSPMSLISLLANDIIDHVQLCVTTPFDDPTATLEVGTVGTPDLVFATNENDPTSVAQFGNDQNYIISTAELLRLIITPGASTQGAGFIIFDIRR